MFFHLMKLCVKFSFSTLRLDFPNCLPNVLNLLLKRDKSSCAGQVTEPGVSCRLQQVQLLPVSRALHSHTSTAVCVVYARELIYLLQFTSAAAESWSREKSKHCQPLISDSSRHLHSLSCAIGTRLLHSLLLMRFVVWALIACYEALHYGQIYLRYFLGNVLI